MRVVHNSAFWIIEKIGRIRHAMTQENGEETDTANSNGNVATVVQGMWPVCTTRNLCAWLSSWMTDQLKVPGCVGQYRLDVDQIDNGSECNELWKVIASIARKQASSIHTIGYNMPVRNWECKDMVPPCCHKFQSCLLRKITWETAGCCHSYSQLLCTHRAVRTRLEAERQDLTHHHHSPFKNGSNLWPWFPMDVTKLKPWC